MCLLCSCGEGTSEDKDITSADSTSAVTEAVVSATESTVISESETITEDISETSTVTSTLTSTSTETVQNIQSDEITETASSASEALWAETTALSDNKISLTEKTAPLSVTVPELKVSNVDHSINYLTWTEIEGAQSYVLYLLNEETGAFEEYGEVKNNSCEDAKLTPNTKYTYKVAAKYSDGTVGELSEEKSIYTYNKYGRNSSSGICTSQGEWIYFTDTKSDIVNSDTSIYKMKNDGSEFIKLCDCSAEEINVVGEYLYYADYNLIYRIKTDGTEKELIYNTESYQEQNHCEFVPQIYSMIVSDEYIYFLFEVVWHWEQPDYDMIGRIKTDRTEETAAEYYSLSGDKHSFWGMYSDSICYGYEKYVIEESPDSEGVWRNEYDGNYCVTLYDFDGNEISRADLSCDDRICMLDFDGESLLYIDNKQLYGYSLSDKKSNFITDTERSFDNGTFYKQSIYYNDPTSNSFRKYDIGTGKDIRLLDGIYYAERSNDTVWLFDIDTLSVYMLENDTFVKVH